MSSLAATTLATSVKRPLVITEGQCKGRANPTGSAPVGLGARSLPFKIRPTVYTNVRIQSRSTVCGAALVGLFSLIKLFNIAHGFA